MRKIISKYWNVLQINPELRDTFQNNPLVAFKRKNYIHYISQAQLQKQARHLLNGIPIHRHTAKSNMLEKLKQP